MRTVLPLDGKRSIKRTLIRGKGPRRRHLGLKNKYQSRGREEDEITQGGVRQAETRKGEKNEWEMEHKEGAKREIK